MLKKPNFFIIGAPRCGTTSLYHYLAAHPNIFFAAFKEPYFWASDIPNHHKVKTIEEYLQLFSEVGEEQKCVGEATPLYMYSKTAIPRIHRFSPQAKLIAILRDPIQEVISHHAKRLSGAGEDVEDFECAWKLQNVRAEGKQIPKGCVDPCLSQYGAIARYGEQIERVLKYFPKQQLLILLTEDFIESPREIYLDILNFLNLEDDGRKEFGVKNRRAAYLAPRVSDFFRSFLAKGKIANRVYYSIPKPLRKTAKKLFMKPVVNFELSPQFHMELRKYFSDDVKKLRKLTGLDLSRWDNYLSE